MISNRFSAWYRPGLACAALLAISGAASVQAAPPAPAAQRGATSADIKAVVVKAWGGCSSSELVWDDLNAHWDQHGSRSIFIDYADPALCAGELTYAALAASGAQVVIVSDPSGGGKKFSPAEVAALQRYAQEGHNLIGTFLLLNNAGKVDNRHLAPLFGLPKDADYTSAPVEPTFKPRHALADLFTGIGPRYRSWGFPSSQVPAAGAWDQAANGKAFYAATTTGGERQGAILVACKASYRATFITTMPEFHGGPADKQFLYNAIVADAASCGK